MLKKFLVSPVSEIRRVFKTEDSRFVLFVGLKVSAISFGISLIVYWFIFQIVRMNYGFFQAHGFSEFNKTIFYQFVGKESVENLIAIFIYHIILFFIGCYLGWLILRPFRTIGDYCEHVMDKSHAIYRVEQFNTYALLTRFSEFFFEFLRESRNKNSLDTHSIPPQYSKIHKPVFDKIFALHIGLLLIFISIGSAVFIIQSSSSIFESMIELAVKTLSNPNEVTRFFSQQMFVLDEIVNLTVFLITVSYVLLGFHLYSKVSGPAFGIFATMRAFMKGNHSSRVHLVGYGYVRDYTRKINKYLDYMQNNFSQSKNE